MHPLVALAVVVALVLATAAAGSAWRAGQGRIRRPRRDAAHLDGVALAPGATLVQFSSAYCAPCRATAGVIRELVAARPGVAHVELDIAAHPGLVARFRVLQTPTTLVIDPEGRVRARIAGAVRRVDLAAELDRLIPAAS